jgi:hypothetical protein
MGAWGPGIFSDDDASDIRGDVRDLIADGVPSSEIAERISRNYGGAGPYADAVVRIATALTLHRFGRLEQEIRDKAIAAIDDGSALGEWEGHRDERKRRTALQHAREQLLSPQPAPKKVRKRSVCECPWVAGDVVAYELASGRKLVFVVRHVKTDKGGSYPSITPIWAGDELPVAAELAEAAPLPVRREWVDTFAPNFSSDNPYYSRFSNIRLLGIPNKTPARFRPLGEGLLMDRLLTSGNCISFKTFDAYLEDVFGLS